MMGDQDGQEGADEISGAFEAFNNPGICSRCKGEGEAFTRCTRCPGGAMLQNLQGRELRDAMYIQDQYQEGSGSSMASSSARFRPKAMGPEGLRIKALCLRESATAAFGPHLFLSEPLRTI